MFVFQKSIDDMQLLELEVLVAEWHDFLRKYLEPKDFTINQHYLEHLSKVAREVGLAQTSCVSFERRIQGLKRKIKSTGKVEENAANAIIKTANQNFIKRSKTVYCDEETTDVSPSFCHAADIHDFDAYKLKPLLAEAIGISSQNINDIINYATTVKRSKKVFYDSILKTANRRMHVCNNALIKVKHSDRHCIA